MVLKRIIPCLLLKNRRLVKTVKFSDPNYIGDPINAVKIFNDKKVDEIILLDIEASKKESKIDFNLIEDFANECFMPLTYGGGVKSMEDFKHLFFLGAEKVVVNTLFLKNPSLCREAVKKFGSQSIVVSLDVVQKKSGYCVYSHVTQETVDILESKLNEIAQIGFGEIFISSVDREGTWRGYDSELVEIVKNHIDIPIIINGGCGSKSDLKAIINKVSGAAIGSMAVYQKKDKGVLIRFPKREEIVIDEYPF